MLETQYTDCYECSFSQRGELHKVSEFPRVPENLKSACGCMGSYFVTKTDLKCFINMKKWNHYLC